MLVNFVLNGDICEIYELENAQDASAQRMPAVNPQQIYQALQDNRDKNSDININRFENYSICDSIDFSVFSELCSNFNNGLYEIEIKNAAKVFKKKILPKVDPNPDKYSILYVLSIGNDEKINLYSEKMDPLQMEQTYPGVTNSLNNRNIRHCIYMQCTLSPFTSDRLMHELYQQKTKIGSDVKIIVRAVRLHSTLSFDVETCVMHFL